MNSPSPRRPIGQILIAQGVISEDQLRIALLEQMKSNQPVGKLLVALGFVSEATLRDALGESLGHKAVDLAKSIIDPDALRLIPRDLAKRHVFLALSAIDQFYGYELSIDGIIHEIETGQIDMASLAQGQGGYSHPVVRLVDALLSDGVQQVRLRHSLRARRPVPAHSLPHRRGAAPGPRAARTLLERHARAPETGGGHEHRRKPCAAGWARVPVNISGRAQCGLSRAPCSPPSTVKTSCCACSMPSAAS
jgi:hypothetical protein